GCVRRPAPGAQSIARPRTGEPRPPRGRRADAADRAVPEFVRFQDHTVTDGCLRADSSRHRRHSCRGHAPRPAAVPARARRPPGRLNWRLQRPYRSASERLTDARGGVNWTESTVTLTVRFRL